jgi:hypothetical protein
MEEKIKQESGHRSDRVTVRTCLEGFLQTRLVDVWRIFGAEVCRSAAAKTPYLELVMCGACQHVAE